MRIIICGMTASGKSTLAKKLVKMYGLKYLCGGDALKELAKELGYEYSGPGWWETREGQKFLKLRESDPSFDKNIDKKLIQIAKAENNLLLDSWTLAWLFKGKNTLKIWLKCSLAARAARAGKRDGTSVKIATRAIQVKDDESKKIYKELYGFSLGEDFSPFNLVVDTSELDEKTVYKIVSAYIDKLKTAGYVE